jgi:hypothetical protein
VWVIVGVLAGVAGWNGSDGQNGEGWAVGPASV